MVMVDPMVHIRRLTVMLMISGAFNVGFLSLFFYWTLHERPPVPYYELKPADLKEQESPLAIDHSNSEVIRYFRKMPFEWLVARLNNTKLVENGYSQRDLALACLVAFHHFDLDRALKGLPDIGQARRLAYGKFKDGNTAELSIYPGLTDAQFEAIRHFAATERWPLTTKGLFLALRKEGEARNSSLVEALFMSPEFMTVEMLFNRGDIPVEKQELLDVILQGNWQILSAFVEKQKALQDLSAPRRQRFLLDYIQQKSSAAAYLILKTDGVFATNKLDDNHVTTILLLLDRKTPESEQYALAQLSSPRSDSVWRMAATRLYEYAGESLPDQYQHKAALMRFAPHHALAQKIDPLPSKPAPAPSIISPPTKPMAPKPKVASNAQAPAKAKAVKTPKPARVYVVQEGDNLWKISRKFNVDVAVLRAHNKLENDTLRPGRSLKIP